MGRAVVALATFAVLCVAPSPAATQPEPREAAVVYDIYAGGLHALNLGMALRVDGQHYLVRSDLRTMGTVDVMVRWRSEQTTAGRLVDGKARPEWHERDGEWRLNRRSTRLQYDSQGAVEVLIEPVPEEDDRTPVPGELRHGTLDFLSALLQTSLAETPAEACREPVQIFDGRRRYDLSFGIGGDEVLKPSRYGAFDGAALRCEVDVRPIAGFRSEAEGETGLGFPEEITMWLVRDDATRLVLPIRVQAVTRFGAVVVHLSRIDGQAWHQAASPR